jgi:NADPH:quinone reductase-like Zn-dependent oxidoreductase
MIGGSLSQICKSLICGWVLSLGSKKMKSLSAKPNKQDLEFLVSLMGNGIIKPVIDRRYPLDKTADAMNYLSQGHSTGKVIIMVH